jgi:condensation domain-containing protein
MTGSLHVVDEYALSPMQQGMLSQTLEAPAGGVYSIVVSYRLHGPLDAVRFAEAWRRVIAHHPILRTSFEWHGRSDAVQVVHEQAPLEVHEEDWRGLPFDAQTQRLAHFLEEDQRRGFDVRRAPLLRIALFKLDDGVHEFVLTHHHLLMDGSCKPLLFAQVFAAYEALVAGRPVTLAAARPFRAFVEWMRAQPLDAAEAFWRGEMRGVSGPTALWASDAPPAAPAREYEEHRTRLDAGASDALRLWARRQRLTLNTAVTGIWALVLAAGAGSDDVVFGSTLNGRPADLDGIEAMLGLFINSIPVRVRVDRQAPAAAWLRTVQSGQAEAREHGLAPLGAIMRWSGLGAGRPLFESLLVFENNAGYGAGDERYGDIVIASVTPVIRNSLPLTLRCVPDREIELHVLFDARRFSRARVAAVAAQVASGLNALPGLDDQPVAALLERMAAIEAVHQAESARAYETHRRDALRLLRQSSRGHRGTP